MTGTLIVTTDDIRYIVGTSVPLAAEMVPIINDYSDLFDVDTPPRMASYLGQLAIESMFRYRGEIWGPTKAQRGYEGRTDLGNTRPGDGSKFRGYGGIQVTGRANTTAFYEWCVKTLPHMDIPDFRVNPELMGHAPWWVLASFWYWDSRKLNLLADRMTLENVTDKFDPGTKANLKTSTVRPITKKVNGGYNHINERIEATTRALKRLTGRRATNVSISVSRPVDRIESLPVMENAKLVVDEKPESMNNDFNRLAKVVTQKIPVLSSSSKLIASRGHPVDPGVKLVQEMLFAKGYKVVGNNDGRWGQNTLDGVILFRRDHGLSIISDKDGSGMIEQSEAIDAEFLAALAQPTARPLDPIKAVLPTREIAKIVPEVAKARLGKLITGAGFGAAGLPTIGGFIWDQVQGFPDLRAQINPILSALSLDIPNWAWFAILAVVMGVAWWNLRSVEKTGAAAYREGERLAQN